MGQPRTDTRPVSPARRLGHVPAWLWIASILALIGLVVLVRWPFPEVQRFAQDIFEVDQSAGPDRGINLNEVAHSTGRLVGERVTISAMVTTIVGPHAMIIGREGFKITRGGEDEVLVVAGQDDVLVISPDPIPDVVQTGDVAQVTGTVVAFQLDDFERTHDIPFADRAAVAKYNGEEAVLAQSITLSPPVTGPGDKEDPESSDGPERGVTVNEVVGQPEEYLGRRVTVSAEVEQLLSDHALLLSDDKLLVVSAGFGPAVMEEATAVVTGTVQRFELRSIEAELGVDLDDGRFAPYEGRPVVVARVIRMVR